MHKNKVVRNLGALAVLSLAVLAGSGAWAEGTEALGESSVVLAGGTGMTVGGVGLIDQPQPQDLFVAVPDGAAVTQVLLYWISEFYLQTIPDDTAVIEGIEVAGTSIGGATNFFSEVYFEAYRADITDLGLVGPGTNVLAISGLDNSFRTTGAGVLVVYDDGTSEADMALLDGLDLAYWRLAPPLDTTVPIEITFAPSDEERIASVPVLVGSVGDSRPSITEFIVGGAVYRVENLFTSLDGPEWDSQIVDIAIPPGVTDLSMQLLSEGDGSGRNPASMAWLVAGIAISPPPEEPPEECEECDGKVTQLTLQYQGNEADAWIEVVQKKEGSVFAGTVQPGEEFTFVGVDKHGTLGTEIEVFVNGHRNVKIHTSCSKPIGPGLVAGDFEVVMGYSRNGGLLCPVDTPPPPPPPPGDDCDECDGKVTWLTLEYLGGETNALIEVFQKKEGTVFAEVVQPGEQFTFQGVDKKGTLGTEISVYVNGPLNTKMHTSCSKPIGPGLVSGDFLVVDGASRNGGLLCPVEPPEGGCEGDDCDDDGEDFCAGGKPAVLTMVYTGDSCDATNHAQDERKVECDGDPASAQSVWIVATDKADPNDHKARIYFEGQVNLGEAFVIDARVTDLTRLKAETRVFVYDLNGIPLQAVNFHTSCSHPLRAGDQFGSVQLADFVTEDAAKELLSGASAVPLLVPKAGSMMGCQGSGQTEVAGTAFYGDAALLIFLIGLLALGHRSTETARARKHR